MRIETTDNELCLEVVNAALKLVSRRSDSTSTLVQNLAALLEKAESLRSHRT